MHPTKREEGRQVFGHNNPGILLKRQIFLFLGKVSVGIKSEQRWRGRDVGQEEEGRELSLKQRGNRWDIDQGKSLELRLNKEISW